MRTTILGLSVAALIACSGDSKHPDDPSGGDGDKKTIRTIGTPIKDDRAGESTFDFDFVEISAAGTDGDSSFDEPGWKGAATIKGVMQSHVGSTRSCFLDARKKDAALTGLVMIEFVIGPDGKAHEIVLDTEILDDALHACLTDLAGSLRFPGTGPDTKVKVRYPIKFVD